MKTLRSQSSCARAFTLLEVVVVLAITALVLSAVFSIAQGTLTLADDLRRAERRDARTQAFITFCEHLFSELPATAALNVTTTQANGEYLTRLELKHVSSPFNQEPDCTVSMFTQSLPGGGMRLLITSQPASNVDAITRVILFEDLLQCEWRVFISGPQPWVTVWQEETDSKPPVVHQHPRLIKLVMAQPGTEPREPVFWIAPAEAISITPTQAPQVPQTPQTLR